MKKIVSLLLVLVMLLSLAACSEDQPDTDGQGNQTTGGGNNTAPSLNDIDFSSVDASNFAETSAVTEYVKMTVSYTNSNGVIESGDIIIRLYSNVAPITVQNFQSLVQRGFYNGLTFHRVYKNFMIQGGQSTTESVPTIKGEFSSNGVTNNLPHLRGVISMARTNAPNSASSQFFIMHKTSSHLDGSYASFGYVVSGMDTVDGIAETPVLYNADMGEFSTPANTVMITKAVFVKRTDAPTQPQAPTTMEELDFSAVLREDLTATDEVTDLVKLTVSYTDAAGSAQTGEIVIRLFSKVAPITVQNFQTLVKNGYYNGLSFHRVYKNFMLQGGAGPQTPAIKGEFTSNGVTNNLLHLRGVISMARTSEPDSASSQFFIMHQTSPHLDGSYASFGYVVLGMDVVDGIANTQVQANALMNGEMSSPVNPVTIVSAGFVTAQ